MKFKLRNGKIKDVKEMSQKESDEVDKDFLKGALTFAGFYGGISLLSKL